MLPLALLICLPTLQAPAPAQEPKGEKHSTEFSPELLHGEKGLYGQAAEATAAETKTRRPWNLRPVAWTWRADSMSFASQPLPGGRATLGNHLGAGFGASMEVLPFRGGALALTGDYSYGFARALSVDAPGAPQGRVEIAAQHQVGFGLDLGFKLIGHMEGHFALEQRAERYRATGASGTPSQAWISRPWVKLGVRWSLDVIRDMRPFIGVEVAMPLRRENVGANDYLQDLRNLAGSYPLTQGTPSTVSADAVGRAHAGQFQVAVTYGIRVFRPRRKWRTPITAVPEVGKASGTYSVPKEATEPHKNQ